MIDSGSTHNFVDSHLLHQLKVEIDRRDGLRVMVANAETLSSPGTCRNVFLHLSHFFSTDLFILPLSGFDIILGINWLKTMGPIL